MVSCLQALSFERLRGAHGIGSHVRNAAAYVCWALARAYPPSVLGPTVLPRLCPALVATACLDRDVSEALYLTRREESQDMASLGFSGVELLHFCRSAAFMSPPALPLGVPSQNAPEPLCVLTLIMHCLYT